MYNYEAIVTHFLWLDCDEIFWTSFRKNCFILRYFNKLFFHVF